MKPVTNTSVMSLTAVYLGIIFQQTHHVQMKLQLKNTVHLTNQQGRTQIRYGHLHTTNKQPKIHH